MQARPRWWGPLWSRHVGPAEGSRRTRGNPHTRGLWVSGGGSWRNKGGVAPGRPWQLQREQRAARFSCGTGRASTSSEGLTETRAHSRTRGCVLQSVYARYAACPDTVTRGRMPGKEQSTTPDSDGGHCNRARGFTAQRAHQRTRGTDGFSRRADCILSADQQGRGMMSLPDCRLTEINPTKTRKIVKTAEEAEGENSDFPGEQRRARGLLARAQSACVFPPHSFI